jgi:hypothetical protein
VPENSNIACCRFDDTGYMGNDLGQFLTGQLAQQQKVKLFKSQLDTHNVASKL